MSENPTGISIATNMPHKYFITGFTLIIEATEGASLTVKLLEGDRNFSLSKNREVQLGLSLK